MGSSRVRDIAVDPRFFVPSGVIDVRQANKESGDYYYDDSTIAQEDQVAIDPTAKVPLPSSFKVIEQKVRTGSDGRSVVDAYIEFPDIDGIQGIEVQYTPI